MAGPVIPFAVMLARMASKSKVLSGLRKGVGGFEALRKMIEENRVPENVVVLEGSKKLKPEDKRDPSVKEILDELTIEAGGELTPEEVVELLDQLDKEKPLTNEDTDSLLGRDATEAQLGDFDDAGQLIEDKANFSAQEKVQIDERGSEAQRFVQERKTPQEVTEVSQIRQAELLLSRLNIRMVEPNVEEDTNLVVERIVNAKEKVIGEIRTNPITGHTELTLIASDGFQGEEAVVAIPYEDRAQAFNAMEFIYGEGEPITMAVLEELADNAMVDVDSIDIDDFMMSNKQIGEE